MENKTYNRSNFHRHTFCVFQEVTNSEIENQTIGYTSKSGSSYYFTELGVYRLSNHWGRAANCRWRLESSLLTSSSRTKVGFALWSAFHPDNEVEKLYFIYFDAQNNLVTYFHKNSPEYDGMAILRTAAETTALLKSIRHLLTTDAWAKHYEGKPIAELRAYCIEKLQTTNLSLQQIKSQLL